MRGTPRRADTRLFEHPDFEDAVLHAEDHFREQGAHSAPSNRKGFSYSAHLRFLRNILCLAFVGIPLHEGHSQTAETYDPVELQLIAVVLPILHTPVVSRTPVVPRGAPLYLVVHLINATARKLEEAHDRSLDELRASQAVEGRGYTLPSFVLPESGYAYLPQGGGGWTDDLVMQVVRSDDDDTDSPPGASVVWLSPGDLASRVTDRRRARAIARVRVDTTGTSLVIAVPPGDTKRMLRGSYHFSASLVIPETPGATTWFGEAIASPAAFRVEDPESVDELGQTLLAAMIYYENAEDLSTAEACARQLISAAPRTSRAVAYTYLARYLEKRGELLEAQHWLHRLAEIPASERACSDQRIQELQQRLLARIEQEGEG